MGVSQISGTWTHAERKLRIFGLELKAVILALHHWVTVLQATKLWSLPYRHTGLDPFPHRVTSSSGSVPMDTNSRHSNKDQTHSGLSDCDSRPSISTKSANMNQIRSLQPKIVNQIFWTWGTPSVDMFATVRKTYLPQFTILELRLSVRLAGKVDVQVSTYFPAQQGTTQEGKGRFNRGSHIYYVCMWTTLDSFCTAGTYCQGYLSDGKSYQLHAWRLSCRTTKQQDFQRGL